MAVILVCTYIWAGEKRQWVLPMSSNCVLSYVDSKVISGWQYHWCEYWFVKCIYFVTHVYIYVNKFVRFILWFLELKKKKKSCCPPLNVLLKITNLSMSLVFIWECFYQCLRFIVMLLLKTTENCESVIIWNYMEFCLSLSIYIYMFDCVLFSWPRFHVLIVSLNWCWIWLSCVKKKQQCWYSTLLHDSRTVTCGNRDAMTGQCHEGNMSGFGTVFWDSRTFWLAWKNVTLCNHQCWPIWLDGHPYQTYHVVIFLDTITVIRVR